MTQNQVCVMFLEVFFKRVTSAGPSGAAARSALPASAPPGLAGFFPRSLPQSKYTHVRLIRDFCVHSRVHVCLRYLQLEGSRDREAGTFLLFLFCKALKVTKPEEIFTLFR